METEKNNILNISYKIKVTYIMKHLSKHVSVDSSFLCSCEQLTDDFFKLAHVKHLTIFLKIFDAVVKATRTYKAQVTPHGVLENICEN